MALVNLTLPEFAFLEGGGHEKENILEGRNVIIHVRTATVMEIFNASQVMLNPDTLHFDFIYHGAAGDERLTICLHYSAIISNNDYEVRAIMRKCADWYCEYARWEDSDILTNENL